jgi:hypothetical protein
MCMCLCAPEIHPVCLCVRTHVYVHVLRMILEVRKQDIGCERCLRYIKGAHLCIYMCVYVHVCMHILYIFIIVIIIRGCFLYVVIEGAHVCMYVCMYVCMFV